MANGHGGKRNGAGRKVGSTTKRLRPVKDEAEAKGLSPGDVLQAIMERHFADKDWDRAQSAARDLAPYRHPRLAAVEVSSPDGNLFNVPHDRIRIANAELRGNGVPAPLPE